MMLRYGKKPTQMVISLRHSRNPSGLALNAEMGIASFFEITAPRPSLSYSIIGLS